MISKPEFFRNRECRVFGVAFLPTWVAWTGDSATGLPIALMATTDLPTATTMPMINFCCA
jgi:hypothetical protein